MKNRFIVFIIIVFLVGILSGCSRLALLNYETKRDDTQFREMVDKVFSALDSKNKKELKGLFAPNAINSNTNIDNQIDDLFKFYKGPKESDDGVTLVQSSEHNEYGRKEIQLNNDFVITAAGVKYHVYLEMYSRNDENKGEEGIHVLEFATEEAHNSKYFMRHSEEQWDDIPGVYIQTSAEKRSDIMIVNSQYTKYKSVDRSLSVDDFLTFVKKDDDFSRLTDSIGEANGCYLIDDWYYFDLGNKQFVVCGVTNEKVKYMYVANEDKEIRTLWLADDMMKAQGAYIKYTPIKRDLTEDYFKSFLIRSNSLEKLIDEIGQPSGEEPFYNYYKLSDNRFAVCHCVGSGDEIYSVFIADADKKLYTLWESADAN